MPQHDAKTSRIRRTSVLIAVALSYIVIAGRADQHITTEVGDKTVTCMRSGLTSDLKDCGAQSYWYTYVFVGSISAITLVENDEDKINIVPEEVFHGNPAPSLTVLTSQAACLPKLSVGDRWLFFLRKENGKPIVLDYYGNDSRPVADSRDQIDTLRRLEKIGDFGIVRGEVWRRYSFEGAPVSQAKVTARRLSDGTQFVSVTGTDGRYEFRQLPPGDYKITVDPVESFRADASEIDVNRGTCWDLTLSKSPHARLAGHVQRSDGSPVAKAEVILMGVKDSPFIHSQTDSRGHFSFESLPPGDYVVGMNLPDARTRRAPLDPTASSRYYRGAFQRSAALVIKLSVDEKRDDIDFIVPAQ